MAYKTQFPMDFDYEIRSTSASDESSATGFSDSDESSDIEAGDSAKNASSSGSGTVVTQSDAEDDASLESESENENAAALIMVEVQTRPFYDSYVDPFLSGVAATGETTNNFIGYVSFVLILADTIISTLNIDQHADDYDNQPISLLSIALPFAFIISAIISYAHYLQNKTNAPELIVKPNEQPVSRELVTITNTIPDDDIVVGVIEPDDETQSSLSIPPEQSQEASLLSIARRGLITAGGYIAETLDTAAPTLSLVEPVLKARPSGVKLGVQALSLILGGVVATPLAASSYQTITKHFDMPEKPTPKWIEKLENPAVMIKTSLDAFNNLMLLRSFTGFLALWLFAEEVLPTATEAAVLSVMAVLSLFISAPNGYAEKKLLRPSETFDTKSLDWKKDAMTGLIYEQTTMSWLPNTLSLMARWSVAPIYWAMVIVFYATAAIKPTITRARALDMVVDPTQKPDYGNWAQDPVIVKPVKKVLPVVSTPTAPISISPRRDEVSSSQRIVGGLSLEARGPASPLLRSSLSLTYGTASSLGTNSHSVFYQPPAQVKGDPHTTPEIVKSQDYPTSVGAALDVRPATNS